MAEPGGADPWSDWPPGVRRLILDETDSTNAEARRLAEAAERGPLWIMARRQSAGRGRRGRAWTSPPGNLAATLLFAQDLSLTQAGFLSIAAGLAVGDALQALAPEGAVTLKWPNDALLNGRKAAGVLLESAGEGGRVDWMAIGVGMNLAAHPEAAALEPGAWTPTSVAAETGAPPPPPEQALCALAAAMAHWLGRFRAEGSAPLRRAWLARAGQLGGRISARLPRETVTGVFADLDENGALVLDTPLGRRVISAADVYFE